MMENADLVMETADPTDTQRLGARLAQFLAGGDVLALVGELGAGKTAFTQGLACGLGIRASVTSPTFVLINQYRTPSGEILHHADCYRLSDAPAEMRDIGLGDLFAGDDIVVIEWADRIPELLPEEYLEVTFDHVDDSRRRLRFLARGRHYAAILERFSACYLP